MRLFILLMAIVVIVQAFPDNPLPWIILAVVAFYAWIAFRARKTAANASVNEKKGVMEVNLPYTVTYTSSSTREDEEDEDGDGVVIDWGAPCRSVDAELRFNYRSAGGEETERTVQVRQYADSPDGYIQGRCMLRNAPRTFAYKRMWGAVDVDTGEMIDDVKAYLHRLWESDPLREYERIWEKDTAAINVLVYVCKADGRMMAPERALVCRWIADRHGLGDEKIPSLDAWVKTFDSPSSGRFSRLLDILKNWPEADRFALYDVARKVVGTQKTVHVDEEQALLLMAKKFGVGIVV